jgi:CRP/FNR family cyclic AMP-dependent transcriptional regulator
LKHKKADKFDPEVFLANAGLGRTMVELKPKQTFYCQGDAADSVYYLQKGRAKITVVSQKGKEATITLLSAGEFVGESTLAAVHRHCHDHLYRTQDQQKRNDPGDA